MRIFKEYNNINRIYLFKENLYSNLDYLKSLNPDKEIFPVIKSNAYGHGVEQIALLLQKRPDIEMVAVDSLFEAYTLEKLGISKDILIMDYTLVDNLKIKPLKFVFAVSDIDTLLTLNKYQKMARIHIDIDSGMNRLGLKFDYIPEFVNALKECKNIRIEGIMSHFSDADNERDFSYTQKQIDLFKKSIKYFELEGFNFKYRHISASAGSLRITDPKFNAIRPGIAIFGLSPIKSYINDLKPVLSFESTIVQVKNVQKGEYIGYAKTFQAKKDMLIGVIGAGYFEGINLKLSNKGFVKIGSSYSRIIGRVSMNLTTIDLSDQPNVRVGTKVIVFSHIGNDKNSIVKSANMIDNSIYTMIADINQSIKRITV